MASVADAAGIAHVQVATGRAAHAGIMPDDVPADLSIATRTEGWRRQRTDTPRSALVACDTNQAVLGFVTAGPGRDAIRYRGALA